MLNEGFEAPLPKKGKYGHLDKACKYCGKIESTNMARHIRNQHS